MDTPQMTRCPVIFRDDWLMIVDKPAGYLSHPNPARPGSEGHAKTAACAFEGCYDFSERRFDSPAGPVWLIHRLDQDTSGLLMAVLHKDTAALCRALFENRKIHKEYLALVAGRPLPPKGKWRDHLSEKKESGRVRSFVRASQSANAELTYVTRKLFPRTKLSLLAMQLLTGKTHQIRVQAAYHRNPVAGDSVYGDFLLNRKLRKTIGLRRLFLHAHTLSFQHPVTGEHLELQAPLPEALEAVLSRVF